jgi:hypothetical protein
MPINKYSRRCKVNYVSKLVTNLETQFFYTRYFTVFPGFLRLFFFAPADTGTGSGSFLI